MYIPHKNMIDRAFKHKFIEFVVFVLFDCSSINVYAIWMINCGNVLRLKISWSHHEQVKNTFINLKHVFDYFALDSRFKIIILIHYLFSLIYENVFQKRCVMDICVLELQYQLFMGFCMQENLHHKNFHVYDIRYCKMKCLVLKMLSSMLS